MSSYNNCIKFSLDIEKQKIYQAVLLQPACPFCSSKDLIHNGRLKTEIRYIAANASRPIIIRLFKQRVLCRSHKKAQCHAKHYCIYNASKRKVFTALIQFSACQSHKDI